MKFLSKSSVPTRKQFSCFHAQYDLKCSDIKTCVQTISGNIKKVNLTSLDGFNINYSAPGLQEMVKNLSQNHHLSPNFVDAVETMKRGHIVIHGILGMDLIPSVVPLKFISIDKDDFVQIDNGLVPVGNIGASSIGASQVNYTSASVKCKTNVTKSRRKFLGCAKTNKVEICAALKQGFNNKFDVLPDFVAHHLDNQFSLANSYGEERESASEIFSDFQTKIEFKSGKYHVHVPFEKHTLERVPDNLSICKVLARKVNSKLKAQNLDKQYFDVFKEQLEEGIIQPLEPDFDIKTHKFVPNRPIIRTDPYVLTTKIRPVFNCSFSVSEKPSINDAVNFPPDLMCNLVDLLLYFRSNEHFITGDIAKAFLNIKFANEADSKVFSFVVFHEGKFHYFRYNSVIFGFVLSPFFLQAVLKYHASLQSDLEIRNYLSNNFYVDNLVLVSSDQEKLAVAAGDLYDSLDDAGFHLRQWNSNLENATENVDSEDSEVNTSNPFKVLGLVCDPKEDTLSLKDVDLSGDVYTRRQILSKIASIFDPLGILLPCTSAGSLILREITRLKLGWDDAVPPNIALMWSKFSKQISKLNNKVKIPRFAYKYDESFDIKVFCDASKELIGCSIYVVQNGESHLLLAKSKLAPLKEKTMPCLEALGIEIAVKVLLKVLSSKYFSLTNLQSVEIFSDSQVALTWVLSKAAPKRNLFACNRVKSITNSLQKLADLRINFKLSYINTCDNVADLLTRPLSAVKFLKQTKIYFHGPEWLLTDEYPVHNLESIPSRFIKDKKLIYATHSSLSTEEDLVDLSRFSSHIRLVNSLAFVFKIKDIFLKRNPLEFVEYKQFATNYLIKTMQLQNFPVEINYLQKNLPSKQPPVLVRRLRLYLDGEGIIRSKGRIPPSSGFKLDAINPVLLSGKSRLARLLIEEVHKNCNHMSVNTTLYALRNIGYWLTSARSSVASVLRECMVCLKHRARCFPPIESPDLPTGRTSSFTPFASVGMDYTGHFYVRDFSDKKIKVYILLFTCLTTRAVHLEVVNSMSVLDFLNAFLRFTARYGIPMEVYSDNAKTFTTAANLLRNIVEQEITKNFFSSRNILFKNVPVYSANQAGSWERIVRLCKETLYKAYAKNTIFTFDQFVTTLADVQRIINNRPLCYNSTSQDLDVISPNMLLSYSNTFPLLKFSKHQLEQVWGEAKDSEFLTSINNHIKDKEDFRKNFLEKWLEAYILDLRQKHGISDCLDPVSHAWIREGSICLFKIPMADHYPLVKISKLLPGSDGRIRNVEITKPDQTKVVVSVRRLSPLEIVDTSASSSSFASHRSPSRLRTSQKPCNSNSSAISQKRPQRGAACKAKEATRKMAMLGLA